MSKNPKKGQVAPSSLIALGAKNKTRPTTNTIPPPKRSKLDELSPSSLVAALENVRGDPNSAETYIINYINSIKSTLIISSKNGKIIPSQGLALLIICKRYPNIFEKQPIVEYICNILSYTGKESTSSLSSSFKPQTSTSGFSSASKLKQLHILLGIILYASHKDNNKWPLSLVKAYLDDSFGERNWVDMPECSLLVQNIETAFPKTGIDVRHFYSLNPPTEGISGLFETCSKNSTDPNNPTSYFNFLLTNLDSQESVRLRYENCKTSIDALIAGYLKDVLEKRYMMDTQSRAVIRTLTILGGASEVRGAVVNKIDSWLSQAKLQTATLNMLSVMAHSCFYSVANNQHDINFAVHLMLKVKYKLNKPNIQVALLECLRKIIEIHPTNLYNLISIYVNNELFGIPSVILPPNTQPVAPNKLSPFSITFPAVYFASYNSNGTNNTNVVKIISDLIHEYTCQLYLDIRPIRNMIRDMCRCLRTAHFNTNNIYTSFISTTNTNGGTLPESLDLLDLTHHLLIDRSSDSNFINKLSELSHESNKNNNVTFAKAYMDNMIAIITDLQLLATIKPSVKEALKNKHDKDKKNFDIDTLRGHFTILRNIRYLACKWIKNIYRFVESHVTSDQMVNYLKQVLFLNIIRSSDFSYNIDDSYNIHEVWANETDKACLFRGLTEIPLSEKLIQTLLSLCFDKTLCFRPIDIVDMLSEMIIRASTASSSQIVAMNISKGEIIINNMYACCCYDATDLVNNNELLSDEIVSFGRTFAFKSTFWNVCQALVIIASHCPETCGTFLWDNYPTVKNLMKIVITNNFDNYHQTDTELFEEERNLRESESRKIKELESMVLEQLNQGGNGTNNFHLSKILMTNLPLGPTRQPPIDVLKNQQMVFQHLRIGDRLSQSRSPDFLLEIVKSSQQNKSNSNGKAWIIDLVMKTSDDNVNCLPLLCLTEFIFNDIFARLSLSNQISSIFTRTNQNPSSLFIGTIINQSNNADANDDCLKRIVTKIRSIIQKNSQKSDENNSNDDDDIKKSDDNDPKVILSALSLSIFNRLSHWTSFTRKVARECLYIIMQPIDAPINCMTSLDDYKCTLKTLIGLKIVKSNLLSLNLINIITDSLKSTIQTETEIEILISYLDLFSTLSTRYKTSWLHNVALELSYLILKRPVMLNNIEEYELKNVDKQNSIFNRIAGIYLAYNEYLESNDNDTNNNNNNDIKIKFNKSEIKLTKEIFQAQLYLLCISNFCDFQIENCVNITNLLSLWINDGKLIEFEIINDDIKMTNLIEQWLIDCAIESGSVTLMSALLNYHVEFNKSIQHRVTMALSTFSSAYCRAYLNTMEQWVNKEPTIVEKWLSMKTNESVCHQVQKAISKMRGQATNFRNLVDKKCREATSNKDEDMEITTLRVLIANKKITPKKKTNSKQTAIDNKENSTDSIVSIVLNQLTSFFTGSNDDSNAMEVGEINDEEDTSKVEPMDLVEMDKSTFKSIDYIELSGLMELEADSVLNLVFGQDKLGRDLSVGQLLHEMGPSLASKAVSEAAHKFQILPCQLKNNASFLNSLNPTRILDFTESCHQLPSIKSSVTLNQSAQQQYQSIVWYNTTPLVCRTRQEMHELLCVILWEIWIIYNKQTQLTTSSNNNIDNDCSLTDLLSRRCQMIYHCSNHAGLIKESGEILQQFLDKIPDNFPIKQSLAYSLYCSFLELIPYRYRQLTQDIRLIEMNKELKSEIGRVGSRILETLSIGKKEIQDMGIKSARALAVHHPNLFLGLLDQILALVEGAFETNYLDFHRKRSQNLFIVVLQLLEICCPAISEFSINSHSHTWHDSSIIHTIIQICHCMLCVLSRLRDEQQKPQLLLANRLSNFIDARLIQLVLYLNTSKNNNIESNNDTNNITQNHIISVNSIVDWMRVMLVPELKSLIGLYPQMRSLAIAIESIGCDTVVMETDQLGCDLSSNSSLSTCSFTRALASIQLELLTSFRAHSFMAPASYQHSAYGNCIPNYHGSTYRHGDSASYHEILDLDDVSRRDPCATGMMLGEVRKLLTWCIESNGCFSSRLTNSSDSGLNQMAGGVGDGATGTVENEEKRTRAIIRVLGRYLNTYPDQAKYFVNHCVNKGLSGGSLNYWSRPNCDLTLKIMCQIGMLVPAEVPKFLSRASRAVISGRLGRFTFNFRDAMEHIETITDELSLETFVDANISSELMTIPDLCLESSNRANATTRSTQQQQYHHREKTPSDRHHSSGLYKKDVTSSPTSFLSNNNQKKRNFMLDDNPIGSTATSSSLSSRISSGLPMPVITNPESGVMQHQTNSNYKTTTVTQAKRMRYT